MYLQTKKTATNAAVFSRFQKFLLNEVAPIGDPFINVKKSLHCCFKKREASNFIR